MVTVVLRKAEFLSCQQKEFGNYMNSNFRSLLLRQRIDLNHIHSQALLQRITAHRYTQSSSPRRPVSLLHVLNRCVCTQSAHINAVAQESKPVVSDKKPLRSKSWPRPSSPKFRPDDKINSHRSSDRTAAAPHKGTDHTVRNTTRRSFQPVRYPQSGQHISSHKRQSWPTTFRPYAETERVMLKNIEKPGCQPHLQATYLEYRCPPFFLVCRID